jgi:hypothetical protein
MNVFNLNVANYSQGTLQNPITNHISSIMLSNLSNSHLGGSTPSLPHDEQGAKPEFKIGGAEADILQEYLQEFQEADTSLCVKIIEKTMAEVYMLQPEDTPFNKKEVREVCFMSVYTSAYLHFIA